MTLVEAVIVVLLLGVVLLVLAGAAGWTRERAKDQLAWRMLAVLDQALRDYYQAEQDYPPGQVDRRAEQAAAALLGHAKSRGDLVALPRTLRGGGDGPALSDPWGKELLYLTGANDRSGRVPANSGRPIFVLVDGRGSDALPPGQPPTDVAGATTTPAPVAPAAR